MLGWSARHAIRKPDGHALTLVSMLRRPVARAKRGNPAPQPPAVPYFADRCARFPGFALEPCPDRFRGRAPDDGSLQRNRRDVILECRTLRDHRIPALEMFELRPLRHQLPEPIGHDANRNIAHRECRAGDEGLLRERGVENLHCIGGLRLRGGDRRLVALLRRRANQAPERAGNGEAEHGELPVHPLAGERARLPVSGLELADTIARGKIADDGIGFPHRKIAVLQRGHQPVGIHSKIGRLLVAAEFSADVDALVLEPELADRPHHLLNVRRGIAPPNFQHGILPIFWMKHVPSDARSRLAHRARAVRTQLIRLRHRLDAALLDADLTRRGHDRGPDIIGQRHTARKPLLPHALLGLARREHFAAALHGARALHRGDVARDLAGKRCFRIHALGIDVERQHAVREWPPLLRCTGAAERAAEQLADQRQPGPLVFAEGADRAFALAVVARPPARLVIAIQQMRIAALGTIATYALVGSDGSESGDPHLLYGDYEPGGGSRDYSKGKGAIRAFGEHKGSGLALICELLGGALSGTGATQEGRPFANGMLSFYIDPERVDPEAAFAGEVARYIAAVKSLRPVPRGGEVLTPGEPEQRMRAERLASGVPLTDDIWASIVATARQVGIEERRIQSMAQAD